MSGRSSGLRGLQCIGIIMCVCVAVLSAGCLITEPTYTIGVSADLAPYSFMSSDGELEGMDIDIMNWIAEDQGFTPVYRVSETMTMGSDLESGITDIESSLFRTPEREEKYLLSDTYVASRYALAKRVDSDVTMQDVRNGTVSFACEEGGAGASWIKGTFGDEKYNELAASGDILLKYTPDAAFYSVLSNQADVVIASEQVIASKLSQYPPLSFLGYASAEQDIVFAMNKSNTALAEKINAGIANLKASPDYEKILEKYHFKRTGNDYVIGIYDDYPPFSYVDENGELTGFDVEIARWIAGENGFNITFATYPWSQKLTCVILGDVDVWLSGLGITDKRAIQIQFSDAYYTSHFALATRGGTSSYTMADLADGKISVGFVGDAIRLNYIPGIMDEDEYTHMVTGGMIHIYSSPEEVLAALRSGEIEGAILGEDVIAEAAKDGDIRLNAVLSVEQVYAAAVQNGNIALADTINKGLAEMKSTGRLNELRIKYNLRGDL